MKAKFIPLTGFLLLFAGLGYAGWLAVTLPSGHVNARDILTIKQNSTDFKVPSREELALVQDISKKLILIANPRIGTQPDVDLRLLGEKRIVRPVGQVRQRSSATGSTKRNTVFSYNVTFTFVSDQNQYCYINKKFYQQGDVMSDGGTVSRIESQRVLITKNNIAEWVPVKSK